MQCHICVVFCSGVDIVGPSHVSTLFQSIPSYWAPMKKQLVHRVGDVENDQELNERISPYYHADKIKVPLLIGQGANDPRVKQAEADQIYNAMKVCTAYCLAGRVHGGEVCAAEYCGHLSTILVTHDNSRAPAICSMPWAAA